MHKNKIYLILGAVVIGFGLIFTGLFYVNKFFESNQFKFQFPIEIKKPIWIEKRVSKNHPVEVVKTAEASQSADPVVEQKKTEPAIVEKKVEKKYSGAKVYMHEPEIREYVCSKFGEKCDIFIAVLKAENGTHECTRDNAGLNKNGSIDIGLAQINWTPKSPYSKDQLRDCKFNLDVAIQKYNARGFQPWVAYNSGAYKKHLIGK